MYIVYKATSRINGKSYIGYTKNLKKRKSDHKYAAANNKYPNKVFHKAIRKYGWDSFDWEILFESEDKDLVYFGMEPHFITEYDTINNGYNLCYGGAGNSKPRTEQEKKHLSDILKGRKKPDGHGNKVSKALKNRIFSKDTLLRMSKSQKKCEKLTCPVCNKTIDKPNFIRHNHGPKCHRMT